MSASTNELLGLISGPLTELPRNVRLLVTSRPEGYITRALSRFRPFTLEPGEERNAEDIAAFIDGSIRRDGLTESDRGSVATTIKEKSEVSQGPSLQ